MQPKHGPGCTRRDHEPHVNLMSPTRKIQHLCSANLRQHTHRVTLLPERRTSGSGQVEPRDAITPRPGPPRATRCHHAAQGTTASPRPHDHSNWAQCRLGLRPVRDRRGRSDCRGSNGRRGQATNLKRGWISGEGSAARCRIHGRNGQQGMHAPIARA